MSYLDYQELADMLAPVGLNVVLPGESVSALPCITLEPTGLQLLPGVLAAWDTANIAVRYPLAQGDPHQWSECRMSTVGVVGALKGTQVALSPEIEIYGEADAQQPCVKYVVAVTFPSAPLCPDPEPTPLEDEEEE